MLKASLMQQAQCDLAHVRANRIKLKARNQRGPRSVATAEAAAATTATRESGWLRGRAVTGAIRRAEHRKLNRVLLPRALRAGNFLRLVQHNLLKVRLAILTDVFVDRHY